MRISGLLSVLLITAGGMVLSDSVFAEKDPYGQQVLMPPTGGFRSFKEVPNNVEPQGPEASPVADPKTKLPEPRLSVPTGGNVEPQGPEASPIFDPKTSLPPPRSIDPITFPGGGQGGGFGGGGQGGDNTVPGDCSNCGPGDAAPDHNWDEDPDYKF